MLDLLERETGVMDQCAAALRTPKDDKIARLIEHAPENFSIPTWAGNHIEITMFEGRSIDAKRSLYRAIVSNLEPIGVPANDIKIILIEVPASDVGMRGGLAACDLNIGYEITI